MKAKDALQKIQLYDAQINSKLEELSRLKTLTTKVTAAMGSEVISGTKSQDKMGDTIAKIVDMETEINRLVDAYISLKTYFSDIIDSLSNPKQIKVLYGYYFHGKSFDKIADELGYCRRNVCYIHGDALLAVEKKIKEKG